MLDMLYAHNRKPTDEEKGEGEAARTTQGAEAVASLASRISTLQASSLAQDESVKRVDVGCLDNRGSVKAFAEKFNSGGLPGASAQKGLRWNVLKDWFKAALLSTLLTQWEQVGLVES